MNWRTVTLGLKICYFQLHKWCSFYNRGEFLAVRNTEGSFYICQAMQNIFKTSARIRIRWLSQEKKENKPDVYIPDFYDVTGRDFRINAEHRVLVL
jgi:hypothetical protein